MNGRISKANGTRNQLPRGRSVAPASRIGFPAGDRFPRGKSVADTGAAGGIGFPAGDRSRERARRPGSVSPREIGFPAGDRFPRGRSVSPREIGFPAGDRSRERARRAESVSPREIGRGSGRAIRIPWEGASAWVFNDCLGAQIAQTAKSDEQHSRRAKHSSDLPASFRSNVSPPAQSQPESWPEAQLQRNARNAA